MPWAFSPEVDVPWVHQHSMHKFKLYWMHSAHRSVNGFAQLGHSQPHCPEYVQVTSTDQMPQPTSREWELTMS